MSEYKKHVSNPQTARLQLENQRMEERLRTLKKIMAVEKVQRGEDVHVGHWKSGQGKPLSSKKINKTAVPSELGIKKQKHQKIKVLTGKEQEPQNERLNCGQCENYKASIACVECRENYCTVCFTKFHHKGALSHHHVQPLSNIMVKECPNPKRTSSKEMRTCSTGIQHNDSSSVLPDKTRSSDSDLEKERTGSLLEGTYNEEESSRLFQEALMAWRSSQNKEIKEVTTSSCGIQATDTDSPQSKTSSARKLELKYTSTANASYMEKLMLKKKHSDPSFLKVTPSYKPNQVTQEDPITEDPLGSTAAIPSEHNLFYTDDKQPVFTDKQSLVHLDTIPSPDFPPTSSTVEIQEVTDCIAQNKQQDAPPTDTYKHDSSNKGLTSNKETQSGCVVVSTKDQKQHSLRVPAPNNTNSNKSKKVKSKRLKTTSSNDDKEKSKPSQRSIDQDQPSPPTGKEKTYKGLSDFFLMGTEERENLAQNEDEYNPFSSEPDQSLPISSTIWIPSNSAVSEQTQPQNDNEFSCQITHSDLPPRRPPSFPEAPEPPDALFDSNGELSEETLTEDSLVILEERSDENNDDNKVLDELSRELMSANSCNSVAGENNTESDEERVWSQMTLEELVQDFEEYQTQVINEDM